MTAAVMSNYFYNPAAGAWRPVSNGVANANTNSGVQMHNWMMAQVAQYPQHQQHGQHHYDAMYQANGAGQPILDSQHQLQYGDLGQVIYPKVVDSAPNGQPASAHQVHDITHQLQHHGYEEQQMNQQMQSVPQTIHTQPLTVQTSQPPQDMPEPPQKVNRLRKACDSCSIRKVRCDESGPPCRACTALDIPCTFDRPSRRRGPPNRYAESIKRRRIEETNDPTRFLKQSSPSSPNSAAQALAALSSRAAASHPPSAESICPISTLDALINDFFTYIHPLCPFPHEPSFREAWKNREDQTNTAFLALLASMVGTLVASIPRKPRLYLAAQRKDSHIPDNLDLVGRCQRICTMARGSGYLENENLSVYDAATSYFLGLSRLYTHNWRLARLYFGECLSIIRTLGLHRDNEPMHVLLGKLPESLGYDSFSTQTSHGLPVDNITREMGRRVFWTMFTTVRSMQQLSAEFRELHIPPSTPTEAYPPLPTEVDDVYIYPTHNDLQQSQSLSLISGFNKNVQVFRSYDWLASMETALGRISVIDWPGQLSVLYDALRKCKNCETELPAELVYTANTIADAYASDVTDDASVATSFAHSSVVRDTASSFSSMTNGDHQQHLRSDQRRYIQNAIQKGNIHASILSTRAYIVQKFWVLYEAHQQAFPKSVDPLGNGIANGLENLTGHNMSAAPDFMEQEMRQESELVIKDILAVLGSIKGVNVELNADNFTAKIRALASMLLQIPDDQGEQPFHDSLSGFLQSLERLERKNSVDSALDYQSDDDSENREWAELQACRMQLAELATS